MRRLPARRSGRTVLNLCLYRRSRICSYVYDDDDDDDDNANYSYSPSGYNILKLIIYYYILLYINYIYSRLPTQHHMRAYYSYSPSWYNELLLTLQCVRQTLLQSWISILFVKIKKTTIYVMVHISFFYWAKCSRWGFFWWANLSITPIASSHTEHHVRGYYSYSVS